MRRNVQRTHNSNLYFDLKNSAHMIHVQCTNGRGIVPDGEKTEGELSEWQNDARGIVISRLRIVKKCFLAIFLLNRKYSKFIQQC